MSDGGETTNDDAVAEDNRLGADLAFTQADVDAVFAYIRANMAEVFKIPQVRAMLTLNRLERVADSQVKVFDRPGAGVMDFTVGHNLAQLRNPSALLRPGMLIDPLCSIDFVFKNINQLKVLTVGPRNECEIFTLIAGGFRPQNITALDLISYSKFIDLGDMHAMPYGDDAFDVVLLSWVLGYSDDIPQAISETMRVARPGAFIGIGGEYNPEDKDPKTGQFIARAWHRTDTLLQMFGDAVDQVIFRQDRHPARAGQVEHVSVIFTLKGDLGL